MFIKNIKKDPFTLLFTKELYSLKYLKKNDKIIIAVSGGLDSIALLFLLHHLNRYKLIVAHIDHSIREDSVKDRIFVEGICADLNIQFFSKKLEINSRPKIQSIEEWARQQRYEYFKNLCHETKSRWVMTGHHCNDHTETILMNLSRKTGVIGLAGIPKKNGKIIRPLLSFTKKEVCDFVTRVGLPFIEDSTNFDISIPRNFIRRKVVKPWELKVPHLIKAIYKSSQYFEEWKLSLDQLLRNFIINHLKISDKKIEIPLSLIGSLPNLGKSRLFQLLFEKDKTLWSKHDLEMLEHFINKGSTGKTFNLINSWLLLYNRGKIIAFRNRSINLKRRVSIEPNKSIYFNNSEYKIITNKIFHNNTCSKNEELVDWSKLKNKKLKIRIWDSGDIFQPLGMKNKKKISDFLVNEKINIIAKKSQSVLTVDGEVAWVCGLRISEWVKITENTKEKALLKYNPL